MKVTKLKKKDEVYYYIQQTVLVEGHNRSETVRKLGKRSELLKITDDPDTYAQQIADQMTKEAAEKVVYQNIEINYSEKVTYEPVEVSRSTVRNIGYFFLQELYHRMNIAAFFRKISAESRIRFDPDLVNRFLTYDRILSPRSKLQMAFNSDWYYGKPQIEYQHILRTMDLLADHFHEYIEFLFHASEKIVPRDTSCCYYDCTNYYSETETADEEEYVDVVTGEVRPGYRQYGPSKEHRPNPIVEMGLIMDRQGIPITMCLHPGNQNEQATAIPLEQEVLKMTEGKEFIYVADSGLGSYSIRNFNAMGGRSFIVTQSIKKLSGVLQNAVFNDCDYRLLSDDRPVTIEMMKSFDRRDPANLSLYQDRAYKLLAADTLVDLGLTEEYVLKNGKTQKRKVKGNLKQTVIITFSRKMMEYQRAVRSRQIERAKALIPHLDPDTYKKGPNDVTRFIKKTSTAKDGGAVITKFEMDYTRIEEEKKYDGYYAIATNLVIEEDEGHRRNADVRKILQISATRNRIEECFRITKTNFSARPIYHRIPKRIEAHFLICYTSLLLYRLLELKLEESGRHHTVDSIISTLRNMNVVNCDDLYYQAAYRGSNTLDDLNKVFHSDFDKKYYRPTDLNK